jgi:hypothetical protein
VLTRKTDLWFLFQSCRLAKSRYSYFAYDTSIIATLDEQGKLVFPQGEAFTPDSSVRINIVGHPETLEKVGATLPVTLAPLKYLRV